MRCGMFFGWHPFYGQNTFFPWYGILGIIFQIVIIIGIIALITYLVKQIIRNGKAGRNDSGDPLLILKERLAKGEITEEEFEKMKRYLT